MLQTYQNHPSVLMWAIGNEPNKQGTAELASWFTLTARLARIRDQECPRNSSCWHPITVPIKDGVAEGLTVFLTQYEQLYPQAVDVWSKC
jgi:hypothetical protein